LTAAAPGATLAAVTLTELLAALAVVGLVVGGVLAVTDSGHRAHADGAARVAAQQSARIALERMAREIRQAGVGFAPVDAIAVAEPERIVLHLDHDGDGVIAPTRETVTWRRAGRVLRRNAGGGAQPIVNGVAALRLDYFDVDGRPTAVPGEVRSVAIALTVEADGAPRDRAARTAITVTTLVRLRNR